MGKSDAGVENGCAEPVARGEAALGNGEAALRLLDEGPLDVPPAGTSVVRVRLVSSSPAVEDIVLIPIVSPEPELRAISIVTD